MGASKEEYIKYLIKRNDNYRADVCAKCPEAGRACKMTDTEVDECIKNHKD